MPKIKDKNLWEQEYRRGKWHFLHGDVEFVRYKVLANYIHRYQRQISLFDIGCGEGVILKHLDLDLVEQYTGLDIAAAALEKISPKREQDKYICSPLEEYIPDGKWDVILFNEVLYYTCQPVAILKKFEGCLNDGGFFLVSLYKGKSPFAYHNRCIRQLGRYFRKASYVIEDAVELSKIYQPLAWQIFVVRPPVS